MPILKNPWQRQAELIYHAADQLAADLTRLPALQPLRPGQESDLFYESLYYLNLICDKVLAENLSQRRGGDDLEARMNLTLVNVGGRMEKLVLARIGLTPQSPSYEEWQRAFYTAMKERRGRYGEMDPQQVTNGFGRVALQTLGKAADEHRLGDRPYRP